jgi:hypothetical protein
MRHKGNCTLLSLSVKKQLTFPQLNKLHNYIKLDETGLQGPRIECPIEANADRGQS